MMIQTFTLFVIYATFSSIQGLKDENKGKFEPTITDSDFDNAKEQRELFNELRETHIPLGKTGLVASADKDNSEDFEGDVEIPEEIFNKERSSSNREEVEDDLENLELVDNGDELDSRPGWLCRRRRWWGSCRRVRAIIKRRRRRRRRGNSWK